MRGWFAIAATKANSVGRLKPFSVQARISGRDDRADGLLVKTLVAFATLEVFKVTADRAVTEKLCVLLGRDPGQRSTDRRGAWRPASARPP